MPLTVNTIVHLPIKVELREAGINAFLEQLFEVRQEVLQQLLQQVVQQIQEAYLQACHAGVRELVCRACGVVHEAGGWVRRGTRSRQLATSSGTLRFSLVQVTCRACGATRVAAEELLGLEARQRVSTELKQRLVERVFTLSYARSAEVARSCLGVRIAPSTLHRFVQERAARLQLKADPESEVLLVDGTKVRAGERKQFEDLRMALQVLGREVRNGRTRAQLRLVALEVGPGTWPQVLGGAPGTKVVVTDAELPLRAHVRRSYPAARHQFCEWHVGHTLNWSLRVDGVEAPQRRSWRQKLGRILWGEGPLAQRQQAYADFTAQLSERAKSYGQLREARPYILFDPPSPERTTSLVERQMREVDRRAWIGVRWSTPGLANLLRLSFARTHNPDDYARVWT